MKCPGAPRRARRLQRADVGEHAHGREARGTPGPGPRASTVTSASVPSSSRERAGVSVTVVAGGAGSAVSGAIGGARAAAGASSAIDSAGPRNRPAASSQLLRDGEREAKDGVRRARSRYRGRRAARDRRPMLRAISRLTARPSPVPCSSPLVVKNDSNSRWRTVFATPDPLSATSTIAKRGFSASTRARTWTTGCATPGDRVQRVGQQVDQDLLERVRRDHQRRQIGRDLRAQGRAALAQAEVEQRRHAHQHGAELGAPGRVLGRGHRQQAQVRHQRRQPLRLLDDVAREVQHLVQLDAILLEQQLRRDP